jgi:hypothetical protein
MAVLTVGAGKEFSTLSSAVTASHDGDTIQVQAGTYANDFTTVTDKITIEGVGGMAHFVATEPPPNGKAILTIDNDTTVENLGFSGAAVSDADGANGAGIRLEQGSLVVKGSNFTGNQMGILTANLPTIHLTVLNSEFGGQSTTSASLAHQLYAGNIGSLDVENSLFLADGSGHQIKSRAASTTIKNNIIDDGKGNTSYDIDLPNGGNALIEDNTIVKGVNDPNTTVISYGEEGMSYASNSLLIQSNIIDNQLTGNHGVGLRNDSTVTAHIDDNQFYNLPTVAIGPNEQTGNVTLATAPTVHDVIPGSTPSPSPTPTPTPTPTPGGSGPVIASPDAVPTPHEARHLVLPDHSGTATGPDAPSVLMATAPNQTLIGHGGDDIFQLNGETGVTVSELGHGTATVLEALSSYTLPTGIADLTASGTGAQTLIGNAGNNYIQGNNASDVIIGGGGNDTIAVGTGANTITGGTAGHDLFVFSSVADHGNVITDFTLGQDELDLRGLVKSAGYTGHDPVADHVLQLVQSGTSTNVVIDPHGATGGGHTVVTLQHVVASSLTEGHDFIWH